MFEIQEKDTTVIKGFNCNICEDYIYKDLMICWIVNCSISKVESVQFLLNALLQNLRCFFIWTSVIVLCYLKRLFGLFQLIVVCLSMYIESLAYKCIIYFKIVWSIDSCLLQIMLKPYVFDTIYFALENVKEEEHLSILRPQKWIHFVNHVETFDIYHHQK